MIHNSDRVYGQLNGFPDDRIDLGRRFGVVYTLFAARSSYIFEAEIDCEDASSFRLKLSRSNCDGSCAAELTWTHVHSFPQTVVSRVKWTAGRHYARVYHSNTTRPVQ